MASSALLTGRWDCFPINNHMNKRERRYLPATELRVQTSDSGENVIQGMAVVYSSLSEDIGFREMVAPGAFTACLATNPDVRCLFNHDTNLILGRTTSGTMTLSDTPAGLAFRCTLPDTSTGRDLAVSLKRGDVSGMSFGFICDQAEWSDTPDYMLRTITAATLLDCSPVVFPAYTAASVSLRSMFPDGEIEIPNLKKEVRDDSDDDQTGDPCLCPCPSCVGGDCSDCSEEFCVDANCDCSESRTSKLLAELITRRLRT